MKEAWEEKKEAWEAKKEALEAKREVPEAETRKHRAPGCRQTPKQLPECQEEKQ